MNSASVDDRTASGSLCQRAKRANNCCFECSPYRANWFYSSNIDALMDRFSALFLDRSLLPYHPACSPLAAFQPFCAFSLHSFCKLHILPCCYSPFSLAQRCPFWCNTCSLTLPRRSAMCSKLGSFHNTIKFVL